jgi:hypothetical protein
VACFGDVLLDRATSRDADAGLAQDQGSLAVPLRRGVPKLLQVSFPRGR